MVGRKRKSSRRLAASHQRSWLWGRNAVLETLGANRWPPLELKIADDLGDDLRRSVESLAADADVPIEVHPGDQLTRWCGTGEHQGLLALMGPYPYLSVDAAVDEAESDPLFLLLDRIQDPHNFGAILRSAAVFAVDAVFVPESEQAEITPHVARSSAGAVNALAIAPTDDPIELVRTLHRRCQTVAVAATQDGARLAAEHSFHGPTLLVIGNEGTGVRPELLAACQDTVRIPQFGPLDSLNAAVAAGILLYEARRQRSGTRGGAI